MSPETAPFCEAAAEWDHDWTGDTVLSCSECGVLAAGQAPTDEDPT